MNTNTDLNTPVLIPLNRLALSIRNVRTSEPERIEALAASIKIQGLLQNLVVSVSDTEAEQWDVEAGGRRFQAMSLLVERGELDADHPIPCLVVDQADATAVSLTENVQREQMHPADEFDAFKKLTDERWSIDRIADAYGVTPLVVERRLRLSAAAPALIEEFRAGALSTDQLIGLCATDNHERQIAVWGRMKNHSWNNDAKALRRAVLAESEVDVSNDPRIPFIGGLDVYRAAGGEVRRDLFTGDGSGGFISDESLLDSLVANKLAVQAESLRAEGWGWVDVWMEFDHQQFYRMGAAPRATQDLPKDVQAKIETLGAERVEIEAEQEAMHEQCESDGRDLSDDEWNRDNAIDERVGEINDEISALEAAHAGYDPAVKASSGALVVFERGKLRIERGLVKTADRGAVAAAAGVEDAVTGGRETESAGRKSDAVSDALRRSLLGHRNLAVQTVVAKRADAAKVLLACWTVKEIRRLTATGYAPNDTPCDLTISGNYGSGTRTHHPITDEAGLEAGKAFNEAAKSAIKGLPAADGKLWDALVEMSSADLDSIIAFGVALTVSVTEKHTGLTAKLLETLGFDMAEHFTPTAENYLGRVSKPLMLAALSEAGKVVGEDDKAELLKMKKAGLASEAESRLAGTRWVPAGIRTPQVKKAKAAPAKKAKAAPAKKAPARKRTRAA